MPKLEAAAPYVIVARDRRGPTGVAVSPEGRVFFSEWQRGAVSEVVAPGEVQELIAGIEHPRGMAWAGEDALLLVADGLRGRRPGPRHRAGVLLRYELESGELSVLADGLIHPRDVFPAPDGSVLVTADGRWEPRGRGHGGGDDEDDWRSWPRLNCAGLVHGKKRRCVTSISHAITP